MDEDEDEEEDSHNGQELNDTSNKFCDGKDGHHHYHTSKKIRLQSSNSIVQTIPAATFIITIDNRKKCKLHQRYNEWLTKLEEEQKLIEKKQMEEQELQQQHQQAQMRQQKQVEKLLQMAQRKQNQLLGVQPNQELNALIITDETHKKAKEAVAQLAGRLSMEDGDDKDDLDMQDESAHCDRKDQRIQDSSSLNRLEDTLIDLKSMPTFRDKPIKQETQILSKEWPLKIPFSDIPLIEFSNEATSEDYFVWPPSSMEDCLANEDILVWLACQTPATIQQLFPVNPKLTRETVLDLKHK